MESSLYHLILDIIQGIATICMFLILTRSLMTWLRQDVIARFYSFFKIVAKITDPLLNLIRRIFPAYMGRVDLSPIIALLLIEVVKYIVIFGVKVIYKL